MTKQVSVFLKGKQNGHKKYVRTKEGQAVIDQCQEDNFANANFHSKEGCRKCLGKGFIEFSHHIGKMQNPTTKRLESIAVAKRELCNCVEKRIDKMMADV